jgi:putative ABC transport system permease protein
VLEVESVAADAVRPLCALVLAMAGLYGIQAHVIARRTREIGVRMSLGATGGQIKRMVLAEGYAPVIQGMAIGAFIGIAGRAVIRSILISRVNLVDPWMFVLVPAPLLLAAFCACYLPARRASRVDPNVALRNL